MLPTNASVPHIDICTGPAIDPAMSSFSIADYLRSLLRHPIVIPSPLEALSASPPDAHSDYVRIASAIMRLMSKTPCSVRDIDRPGSYRVVISCREPVSANELMRRSEASLSRVAGGPHSVRDDIIGDTGGVYLLSFEEMIVFITKFAFDPSFDDARVAELHQSEHDRSRLRRYSFITSPLHMMYMYRNNIPGRNWLPTYFLNHYVTDVDIGSHKYYPLVNHLHAYHCIAEGTMRFINIDSVTPLRKMGAGWRLFALLAFQSSGSNINESRASPSVRIRNALAALTINNNLALAGNLVSRAMNERYNIMSHKVETTVNVLCTTGDRAEFYWSFYEFCTRMPISDWMNSTSITYVGLIKHHHLTPLCIEVFTRAEMLIKCEQDEDLAAYLSMQRESRVAVGSDRFKSLRVCLPTRDHHRAMVVEKQVVRKLRVEELWHPSDARRNAQAVLEGQHNRANIAYHERVAASYVLRSTYDEECKVFIVPGVSRGEFVAFSNRMMPVVKVLVCGDLDDFATHVHSCVDSSNRTTSCYVITTPTIMYIMATVAKLQMYRLLLDEPDAQQDRATILTSVMEIMAVSLRYIGVYGVWVALHSFLIHFSSFRYLKDEMSYDPTTPSRLDTFAASSPVERPYKAMWAVLLVWRLVVWHRDTCVHNPKLWTLQCNTLIHGLVRNNKLNDDTHGSLMAKLQSELKTLHRQGIYKDESAVGLLRSAYHDWNEIYCTKEVEASAERMPISCIMRAINYHTINGTIGGYAPPSIASVVCPLLSEVELMMTLVEFIIGLDGNWMKHKSHQDLFTTNTVLPSPTFFDELPVFYNHASHPIIMREAVALINDPLLQTAFTDVNIMSIRGKFESREKKLREEDAAASKSARPSSSSRHRSSSHRSSRRSSKRTREQRSNDGDGDASDDDERKERFSPAIGSFSAPPSPMCPLDLNEHPTVHDTSINYPAATSPGYQASDNVNNQHRPGEYPGSSTSPAYDPAYDPHATGSPIFPPSPLTNSAQYANASWGAAVELTYEANSA